MNEENTISKFERIDWQAIDIGAVIAFYDRTGRPLGERALLIAPVDPRHREAWQRACIADYEEYRRARCGACDS
ncbi:hypothetical protein [Rhodopseudomonas parapalustris]